MKSQQTTHQCQERLSFNESGIPKVEGLEKVLTSFTRRISISYSSSSTVNTYRRALLDVSLFHGCLPDVLEADQILEYLHYLKDKELSWAKIKLDAAGIR